jgi:hypothetical protein
VDVARLGWEVGVLLLRRDIAGGLERVESSEGGSDNAGCVASLGSDAGGVTG